MKKNDIIYNVNGGHYEKSYLHKKGNCQTSRQTRDVLNNEKGCLGMPFQSGKIHSFLLKNS